jgi:phosphoribosylaminoimidazole carboxylase PurE protein
VIGVPVQTRSLSGLDSLLSIVQMPRGVPVATVAINNARNAGLLAVRMLALTSPQLLARLRESIREQEAGVLEKAQIMEREGWRSLADSEH